MRQHAVVFFMCIMTKNEKNWSSVRALGDTVKDGLEQPDNSRLGLVLKLSRSMCSQIIYTWYSSYPHELQLQMLFST